MTAFQLASLLIITPVAMQLSLGSLSVKKRISLAFEYISLLNCFLQLAFIALAIKIVSKFAENQHTNCGMPQTAIFMEGIFFCALLLFVIIIQIIVRQKWNKK